ncbi:MAG: enoyl-CoA hydratase/isomerase family protein [Proteobacteria bacterium]|nr:enoyl-CoA hydratase/isomerase family protein [Pseudomonadota bacterium]
MALIDYEMDENIAVVAMNGGENRFNYAFFDAFHAVLDEIEHKTQANALIVKSSDEKIWSNGIDLDWLGPAVKEGGTEVGNKFSAELYRLFERLLTYPMITIAAITGHAFAGGAIMSCTFDFRFMRSDRGWLCFPEVDINIPFSHFLNAITKKAVPMYKFVEMQLTGKRVTAQECEDHHIIVKACHIDDLMDEALAFAKTLNKDRAIVGTMKNRLYRDIVRVLEEQQASPEDSSLV